MRALLLGGDGYVGRYLQRASTVITEYVSADLHPSSPAVVFCDVRRDLSETLGEVEPPDWIVLLAAVHREPGHELHEYYDTNVTGAQNVTRYAEQVGCKNILFMSSTSPYGSTNDPKDEHSALYPESPYGMSKLAAELVLGSWLRQGEGRRLVICRPGVIYGPGEQGNITRMIRAVRRGYFVFPGDRTVRKSYAYIEGLVESVDFALSRSEPYLLYNYTERQTETLEELVHAVQDEFDCHRHTPSVPRHVLVGAAHALQAATYGRSQLHPTRVRKASIPTHVIPRWLLEHGFEFRYDFRTSLRHWRDTAPEDFELRA
jgi:nucleoside-diphosphate-sugar epimerase